MSSTLSEGTSAEPWLAVEDVAAHLGVRKDSIYRWIEKRGLPARKIGKLWKFKLSAVDAWVDAGRADEAPVTPTAPPEPRAHRRPGSSPERVVMVIDDDQLVRETIGDFLEAHGYVVALAADGADALQLLGSGANRPDLIILDLSMPNVDGWSFREQQRASKDLVEIPVIVVTAHAQPEFDCAGFLRKPIKPTALLAAIEKVLVPDLAGVRT